MTMVFALFISCKDAQKETQVVTETETTSEATTQPTKTYPANIEKIFAAHGGLDRWNQMNNLCFEMEGRGGVETHTTSLKDRRIHIENEKWTIGYDGSDVWLSQAEADAYKGNARFYHNLMFYFYAMPFVLADDGIQYETIPARELDGKLYEGIKVSYDDGVGDSPKDEYILFYDAETHLMSWLGYTVTYRSNEKSDKWSFIKYGTWNTVNGLTLPKSLTWYNVEEGTPTSARNEMAFEKITTTETILEDAVFAKPEGAEVIGR